MNKLLIFLAMIFLFNGCAYKYSEVPLATNFQTTKQTKFQSSHHWQVISKDLVKSLIQRIDLRNSIYIHPIKGNAPFKNSFYELFSSELIDYGAMVSVKKKKSDLEIHIDVKSIKFSKNRIKPKRTNGAYSLLTGGVFVLHNISNFYPLNVLFTAGALDIKDQINSEYTSVPQHELIITISAEYKNLYVTKFSNIYYISDKDKNLYEEPYFMDIIGVNNDK